MQVDLNIDSKKIDLIKWISASNNESLLDNISELIAKEKKVDWWLETPLSEKKSIEKGIDEADKGKLNPDAKAKDIYGKWL